MKALYLRSIFHLQRTVTPNRAAVADDHSCLPEPRRNGCARGLVRSVCRNSSGVGRFGTAPHGVDAAAIGCTAFLGAPEPTARPSVRFTQWPLGSASRRAHRGEMFPSGMDHGRPVMTASSAAQEPAPGDVCSRHSRPSQSSKARLMATRRPWTAPTSELNAVQVRRGRPYLEQKKGVLR